MIFLVRTINLNLFGGVGVDQNIEKINVEPKQLQCWPKKQVAYKKNSCIGLGDGVGPSN